MLDQESTLKQWCHRLMTSLFSQLLAIAVSMCKVGVPAAGKKHE